MSKITDLREDLGVGSLDPEDRKKLFRSFREAGGKVLEDDPHSSFSFDREKQMEFQRKVRKRDRDSMEDIPSPLQRNVPGWDTGIGLFLWFRVVLTGLTDGTLKKAGRRFLYLFNRETVPALRSAHQMVEEIFQGDETHSKHIQLELTRSSLVFIDLLKKFSGLYHEQDCAAVLKDFHLQGISRVSLFRIRPSLIRLFRKLYILKPHTEVLLSALKAALYQKDLLNGEMRLSGKILQAEKIIAILFRRTFKRLFLLLRVIDQRRFFLYTRAMENYLEILPEERVGFYRPDDLIKQIDQENQKNVSIQTDKKSAVPESAEGFEYSKEDQLDIKLLKQTDIERWKKELPAFADPLDKMTVYQLLFREFEYEYSFFLTSQKIRMQVVFRDNERINYRDLLNDLYSRLTPLTRLFEESESIRKDKAELDLETGMDEIKVYNRKQKLESTRGNLYQKTRSLIQEFTDSLLSILNGLISDIEGQGRIIENPEDTIRFHTEVEKQKKLNSKTVKEIVFHIRSWIHGLQIMLTDPDYLGSRSISVENDFYSGWGESAQDSGFPSSEHDETDHFIEDLDDLLD